MSEFKLKVEEMDLEKKKLEQEIATQLKNQSLIQKENSELQGYIEILKEESVKSISEIKQEMEQ